MFSYISLKKRVGFLHNVFVLLLKSSKYFPGLLHLVDEDAFSRGTQKYPGDELINDNKAGSFSDL
jgi:hypothetical protein